MTVSISLMPYWPTSSPYRPIRGLYRPNKGLYRPIRGLKWSNGGRNYSSLEEFLRVAFSRSYCCGIPTKYPALNRVDSKLLQGWGSTVRHARPACTDRELNGRGPRQLLYPMRTELFIHSCTQVRIEPARRTYYHGSTSHRLILFSELLAV
jgi:hypothetical protein